MGRKLNANTVQGPLETGLKLKANTVERPVQFAEFSDTGHVFDIFLMATDSEQLLFTISV